MNIYRVTPDNDEDESIAWLCDGEWELSPQIDALSQWLVHTGVTLLPGEYVADVGFCWRRDAASGGPILKPVTMRYMADLGMALYLSEYQGFANDYEQ